MHTPRVVAVRNYYVIKIHLKAVLVRHVHTLVEQWKKGEQPRAQLSEGELCTYMSSGFNYYTAFYTETVQTQFRVYFSGMEGNQAKGEGGREGREEVGWKEVYCIWAS